MTGSEVALPIRHVRRDSDRGWASLAIDDRPAEGERQKDQGVDQGCGRQNRLNDDQHSLQQRIPRASEQGDERERGGKEQDQDGQAVLEAEQEA